MNKIIVGSFLTLCIVFFVLGAFQNNAPRSAKLSKASLVLDITLSNRIGRELTNVNVAAALPPNSTVKPDGQQTNSYSFLVKSILWNETTDLHVEFDSVLQEEFVDSPDLEYVLNAPKALSEKYSAQWSENSKSFFSQHSNDLNALNYAAIMMSVNKPARIAVGTQLIPGTQPIQCWIQTFDGKAWTDEVELVNKLIFSVFSPIEGEFTNGADCQQSIVNAWGLTVDSVKVTVL